jgi:hypothetical protein
MKFTYTLLYRIKGLRADATAADVTLIADEVRGLRATITSHPDSLTAEMDRAIAVSTLYRKHQIRDASNDSELENRLSMVVAEIQGVRREKGSYWASLVIAIEGSIVAEFSPSYESKHMQIVAFGSPIKEVIRLKTRKVVQAAINAVALQTGDIAGIKPIVAVPTLRDNSDRPVYLLAIAGRTWLCRALRLNEFAAAHATGHFQLLADDNAFQRVQRLIASSLETSHDPLRSFLSAWCAFEVLVNKAFPEYEREFIAAIAKGSSVEKSIFDGVPKERNGKLRHSDKFAVISRKASLKTADEDIAEVAELRQIRNDLAHGDEVDEEHLPAARIRRIAIRYLRRHLAYVQNATVEGSTRDEVKRGVVLATP